MRLTKKSLLALCIDTFDIRIHGLNLYILINDEYMRINMDRYIVKSIHPQWQIKDYKKADAEAYKEFLDRYFA